MATDAELLRQYADEGSQSAFAELVRANMNFVYTVALRHAFSPQRAEDVTQTVFTDLARKAGSLSRRTELAGWLYTSTRFAAAKLVRTEARRAERDREAQRRAALAPVPTSEPDWERLRPLLDDELASLPSLDRGALLLRFFRERSFTEIGATLHLSDEAARKRVDRALDQLRARLARRGIASTAAALATALTAQTAVSLPPALAARVTEAALRGISAGAGTGVVSTAATTATRIVTPMTTSKLGVGLLAVALIAALGSATYETLAARQAREELDAAQQDSAMTAISLRGAQLEHRATGKAVADIQASLPKSVPPSSTAPNARTRTEQLLRQNPAVVAMARELNARRTQRTYAPLFASLGLSPAQITTFENIIADHFGLQTDGGNAYTMNLGDAYTIRGGSADDRREGNALLRQLLGDSGWRKYESYQQTLPLRREVSSLAGELSGVDPLSSTAANQLLQIFVANEPYQRVSPDGMANTAAFYRHVLPAAQSVLSPSQLDILKLFATRASGTDFTTP